jgi:hypothetical protein
MKGSQAPHEKLNDEEIKVILELIQSHYELAMDLTDTYREKMDEYKENHERLMTKLFKHYFPERFKICTISMGELSDLFSKSYSDNFVGETMKMTREEIEND